MLLIFFVILLPIFVFIYNKKKKRYEEFWKYVMAIPGPPSVPFIGTNTQTHTPESLFLRDRNRMKEFYPIYKLWTFDFAVVIISTPADIELVLSNTKHISKSTMYNFLHAWLGTGLLTSTGTKWHKRRKILTPAFHFNILQEFTDMLNKETRILVENLSKLCDKPYINVVQPITEFTLCSIGETSFGVNLREHSQSNQYRQAVHEYGKSFMYRAVRPFLWIPPLYRFSNAYKRDTQTIKTLHEFSVNLIQERKKVFEQESENEKSLSYSKRKRLALLDLMLKAKENGADIDDEGIREEVDTFVFEGHDTTSVSLCYTLMALANEESIQEDIYQEIISVVGDSQAPSYQNLGELKFMERCIKESLRLYPSVPMFGRNVGENIKTSTGYTIPKGCNVTMDIFDMHRSSEVWDNPLKFDPDRFLPDNIANRHPFAYLPFSAGSRNCIGQRFALLELKAALCGILRNFKLEPVDTPEDMKYKADFVLRPVGEIKVKFVPRLVNF